MKNTRTIPLVLLAILSFFAGASLTSVRGRSQPEYCPQDYTEGGTEWTVIQSEWDGKCCRNDVRHYLTPEQVRSDREHKVVSVTFPDGSRNILVLEKAGGK